MSQVARWLGGKGRRGVNRVSVVNPPATKEFDLRVVVPVPDLTALDEVAPTDPTEAGPPPPRASVWPHVEERVADLVGAHRSTLVFANSRRLAERLTARLNEIWEDRLAADTDEPRRSGDAGRWPGAVQPAQVMAQSGASLGAPAVLARPPRLDRQRQALIERT